MINKAIAKITEEMMQINHPFAVMVEEHLTKICDNNGVAQLLLNPQKSLKEFCKQQEEDMRKKAEKLGTGAQCAGLSDMEFLQRAEEYYGIKIDSDGNVHTKLNLIDISSFL